MPWANELAARHLQGDAARLSVTPSRRHLSIDEPETSGYECPSMRRRLALLSALALLAGCPKRIPSPTEALENADKVADAPDAPARSIALAGFHAWLLASDPAQAQKRFDQALAKDAGEPYAL